MKRSTPSRRTLTRWDVRSNGDVPSAAEAPNADAAAATAATAVSGCLRATREMERADCMMARVMLERAGDSRRGSTERQTKRLLPRLRFCPCLPSTLPLQPLKWTRFNLSESVFRASGAAGARAISWKHLRSCIISQYTSSIASIWTDNSIRMYYSDFNIIKMYAPSRYDLVWNGYEEL